MMNTNDLIYTWEEGNKKLFDGQEITHTMVEKYLKPRISKTSALLVFNLAFYSLVQLVNISLLAINLVGYRSNPVMLSALIPLLIISIAFLLYGYFSFLKLKEIRNYSETLLTMLKQNLSFIRTYYEIWMIIISFSALILIFGLNSLVDNQEGLYRINKPLYYAVVNIGVFLFIYGTQKLSSTFSTRTLKIYLTDLQNSFLEGSQKMENRRKRFRWLGVILLALLLIAFIFGLFRSLNII
jgi:hypothetical protein